MAQTPRQRSVAARSALIAAGVSLGILFGAAVRECFVLDRGECTFTSPTLWLSWVASFVGVWLVVAAATWALEWDRKKRRQ